MSHGSFQSRYGHVYFSFLWWYPQSHIHSEINLERFSSNCRWGPYVVWTCWKASNAKNTFRRLMTAELMVIKKEPEVQSVQSERGIDESNPKIPACFCWNFLRIVSPPFFSKFAVSVWCLFSCWICFFSTVLPCCLWRLTLTRFWTRLMSLGNQGGFIKNPSSFWLLQFWVEDVFESTIFGPQKKNTKITELQ